MLDFNPADVILIIIRTHIKPIKSTEVQSKDKLPFCFQELVKRFKIIKSVLKVN